VIDMKLVEKLEEVLEEQSRLVKENQITLQVASGLCEMQSVENKELRKQNEELRKELAELKKENTLYKSKLRELVAIIIRPKE